MNRVILLSGPDGAGLAQRVKLLLAAEPLAVEEAVPAVPDPWTSVVILVVLTPGALADAAILDFVERAIRERLPVVPVVEDLRTYRFADVTRVAPGISERNATGLEPDSGVALLAAVRGHLGLESFARDQKVFVSFRRSDAEPLARELYAYLWGQRFEAFLDLFQIEGGGVVQDIVMESIGRMDCVLLLDSPDVVNSRWVEAEIREALRLRVPVCRIQFEDRIFLPLYSESPQLRWDSEDPLRFDKARLMISRSIANRRLHEEQIVRTMAAALRGRAVTIENPARRQYLLNSGTKRVLVESEPAAVSIERLHRLHESWRASVAHEAILVVDSAVMPEVTREAIAWAVGTAPLRVVLKWELYAALVACFA
ncbi:conserved hypothetical protein [Candidatus Sulfopaludibacter sp. SbA4]|nr:conserved hypothetical protein [Candidatus Sulfopaludibacter sp. SbA4]